MPRALSPDLASVARELQKLPNVGAATAEDLVRLGVRSAEDLARRDAREMYETLCALDGVRHAASVRDVFAALVEQARTGRSRPWYVQRGERHADEAALPPRVRARLVRDAPRVERPKADAPAPPPPPRPPPVPRAKAPPKSDAGRPAADRWREARETRRR